MKFLIFLPMLISFGYMVYILVDMYRIHLMKRNLMDMIEPIEDPILQDHLAQLVKYTYSEMSARQTELMIINALRLQGTDGKK